MSTWIAFFRGINVGGRHSLPMKELLGLFKDMGASDAKSYIQSGNVVFRNKNGDIGQLVEWADELFESTFAPLLDKAIADGKIASWGWSAHFIGGKYRRLQTMTGADHKSVLAARADLLEAAYGGDKPDPAAVEFTDICGSHTDYLWDIQIETP